MSQPRHLALPQHPLSRNVSDLTPDDQEFWHYHLQEHLPFLIEWDASIDWRSVYYHAVTEDREGDILNELLLEGIRALHSLRQTDTLALIQTLLARSDVDVLYRNGEAIVQLLSKRMYTELASIVSQRQFWERLLENRVASQSVLKELNAADYRRVLISARAIPLEVKTQLLSSFIRLGLLDLTKYLIGTWKLLPSENDLAEALLQGSVELVDLLLKTDEGADHREVIQSLLGRARIPNLTGDVLNLILGSQDVDLNELPEENMSYIVHQLESHIEPDLKRMSALSNGMFSEGDVLAMISSPENTYERLLRELLVKRLSHEEALEWLLSETEEGRAPTQLLGAAANSIVKPGPVVHTSPLFTAYSGFLLFCIAGSTDPTRVLQAMEGEERVTEEGLQLAGALIGASM